MSTEIDIIQQLMSQSERIENLKKKFGTSIDNPEMFSKLAQENPKEIIDLIELLLETVSNLHNDYRDIISMLFDVHDILKD